MSVPTVKELQCAVSQLSPQELARFREGFEEYGAEMWDKQFEDDVKSGKLGELADQAIAGLAGRKLQRTVKHFANPSFWQCYRRLPQNIQD